ncbi:hypothetical protein CLV24_103258 [Pontibacter ummariensis]|uniref:Uncharacterized protein n=1 Tax=Pontibacter ummariensis TaxID=1610492 RepID=A0A239CHF8_9BACT|nr:hypothetical protein [Pontibacter ummariensis]PRY15019.1 hypothetical protein CLV24_103258 [Pontibacter ummariensis]SNS19399.1 hypothetical protein SAMN06296052_10355 [Pontibacter ummariensis]
MTRYLLYFLTGFAVATVILFFRGYASVPQSAYSDAALVAAMVLFSMATWLTLFNVKAGTLLALLSLLTMVPWLFRAWIRIAELEAALAQVILIVHGVLSGLVLVALVVSLRYAFSRGSWRSGTTAPGLFLKILLTLLPLAVLAAWLIVEPKL